MIKSCFPPAALFVSMVLLSPAGADAQKQQSPCCTIIAVDRTSGLVSVKVNANGSVFEFKASNPATLPSLKPGQAVYTNFTNHQVSLDGRTVCCTMTSAPRASTTATPKPTVREPAAPAPASPASALSGTISKNPGTGAPTATTIIAIDPLRLPTISYGTPQPAQPAGRRPTDLSELRTVTTQIGGRGATAKVLRLRGLAGIEQAPGLPEGARRLLEIHVRKLNANEPHDYIVNTALAEQWMNSHPPVPADIKPTDNSSRQSCSGADYFTKSTCDYQAVNDGTNWIRDQANQDWKHASDELTHDWSMAQNCFADHTLPLSDIPVKFSITPNLTIPLASVANGAGVKSSFTSASSPGKVDGSVGLGFPLEGEFVAQLDLFYIPCLPFVVRPKSIAANGTMLVGEKLMASVTATGSFDKTFKIPPTGGPKIPIQMIPIVIAGVPVAELDVSAYIEGDIEVGGSGKADAHFELSDPHKASFSFDCNGGGCSSQLKPVTDPATVMESAEIKGQVMVKPSVYTALQLDFDFDLLSARVGPQPYLQGIASGCAEASAQQASDGTSASEENHALTADLDWGIQLRAEALVAEQVVGKPWTPSMTGNKHLWFRDLAPGGSTALVANVHSTGPVTAAKPASYKVKMPTCYPYTNKIQYRVTWTGEATPAPNSLCQWQAKAGTCQGDPTKDLVISLTWPTVGAYSLTVVPVSDDHHRLFSSAPQVTQVTVSAAPGGGE